METRPTGTLISAELTASTQEARGTVTEMGLHSILTGCTTEAGLGSTFINFQFTVYTFKKVGTEKKGKVSAKC